MLSRWILDGDNLVERVPIIKEIRFQKNDQAHADMTVLVDTERRPSLLLGERVHLTEDSITRTRWIDTVDSRIESDREQSEAVFVYHLSQRPQEPPAAYVTFDLDDGIPRKVV
jgi:hypothetical protein